MKTTNKTIVRILLFTLCAALLFPMENVTAAGASKKALLKKLNLGGELRETWYADFDGDGKKEVFASTAKTNANGNTINGLYFAGSNFAGKLYESGAATDDAYLSGKICKIKKTQRLLIVEAPEYVTDSVSYCFYVKKGKPFRYDKNLQGLKQIKGRNFTGVESAYDWQVQSGGIETGHTYKPYYLKWTGKKFVEYKGKTISKKKLKQYQNGASILRKIKKAGYTVDSIILR